MQLQKPGLTLRYANLLKPKQNFYFKCRKGFIFTIVQLFYLSSMEIKSLFNIDLCILIPYYNNVEGLIVAINSISYNLDKYVIIIVDDGSNQLVSQEAISSKLTNKSNFTIIRLNQNQGITKALNTGLNYIYNNFSAKYIARLDCGDTCAPDRFFSQISFLENNANIHLIGTWCYFEDKFSGETYKYITPTLHKDIEHSMNFRNVFIHPTVMWRVAGFDKLQYPVQYPYAEDYGLFYGMISKVKTAIINEFLVCCEINHQGISIKNRPIQLRSRLKVISDYGQNSFRFYLGAVKLRLLMLIPYQFILNTKKILYKI